MRHALWLVVVGLPIVAMGQTTTYTGASESYLWSDPQNWDNGVPSDGYDVVIPDIDDASSLVDIPGLALSSLTVRFRDNGYIGLLHRLVIDGDLMVMPVPEADPRSCFEIANTEMIVGGSVLLVNCRWREGSLEVSGDFYFQGGTCSFETVTGLTTRMTWRVGGDFWVPVCAWFDVSRTDFVVNGDFVLNGATVLQSSLYHGTTVTLGGSGPSTVLLPVPPVDYDLSIPSVTVAKDSATDLVVLDSAGFGPVLIGDLLIQNGTVELRTDAKISSTVVDPTATLMSRSSIALRGTSLTANGQVSLEAGGLSLRMVAIGTGNGGTLTIAGSPGQLAWIYDQAWVGGSPMYVGGDPGTVFIRDAAIGNCHVSPALAVHGCRDLGFNSGFIFNSASAVAVESLPRPPELRQNFPNPFNSATEIRYELPEPGRVTLRVYDLKGSLVRTLLDREPVMTQGTVTWDGCDDGGVAVAAGAYLYELKTSRHTFAKKMVLLK